MLITYNMHPIPLKLREELVNSGEMEVCIYNNNECNGRVEWEHAWAYAGKQIQERWAIIPCCYYHHRGGGLDKEFNHFKSLIKAITIFGSLIPVIKEYPRKNWFQEFNYLINKYDNNIRN